MKFYMFFFEKKQYFFFKKIISPLMKPQYQLKQHKLIHYHNSLKLMKIFISLTLSI